MDTHISTGISGLLPIEGVEIGNLQETRAIRLHGRIQLPVHLRRFARQLHRPARHGLGRRDARTPDAQQAEAPPPPPPPPSWDKFKRHGAEMNDDRRETRDEERARARSPLTTREATYIGAQAHKQKGRRSRDDPRRRDRTGAWGVGWV